MALSTGKMLREKMSQGTVVLPGVFSAISAKAAAAAGAEGLYISGAGVTNSLLAVPDIALATLTEFAQQATYIVQSAPNLPIISDADTGFGDVHNVARTVIEMERSGLAGIHLEDQLSPKRCGHLDGKGLVTTAEMGAKIRAAVDSRGDPDFLIIARTDARGVEGIDEAIERAKHYVAKGADAVFPEGLGSEAEFEAFRKAIPCPLLANMTEFGKTPIIPASRFADLGYELVIYPQTAFRVMLKAISETYEELIRTGTQSGMLANMRTRAELYDLIDYPGYAERDRIWAEEDKA